MKSTIYYTSDSPIPTIKDVSETTSYIFTHDFEGNKGHMLTEELIYYMDSPSLGNAKALLKAYGIHEPLKYIARTISRNKTTKQMGAGEDKAKVKTLFPLDVLHDLLGTQKPVDVLKLVRRLGPIPKDLEQAFLQNDKVFTLKVAEHMKVKLEAYDIDVASNKLADERLYEKLQGLSSLDTILDNVIAGIHPSLNIPVGTPAFLACAFLHVMYSNMRKLGLIPKNVKEICLYDGTFLHMDSGGYIEQFIIRYVKSIRRNTGVPKIVVKGHDYQPPIYYNRLLDVDAELIEESGKNYVAINGAKYLVTKSKKDKVDGDIVFPHTKNDFAQYIVNITVNNSLNLMHFNFLRDAYKADVAVMNDYLFMTHDILAYIYYKLIGGTKGVFLEVKNHNTQHVAYRICL